MSLPASASAPAAAPVFHQPPRSADMVQELVAMIPGDALLVLPGAGVLLVLALYVLLETGLFSRAGAR